MRRKARARNAGRILQMHTTVLSCRAGCGACCTAPSISSAIPGMPSGKPAGVRCIQLDDANACRIFNDPRRPAVCASLMPSSEMCGADRAFAMHYLDRLERLTAG
jgi:Fe-S-cluster containining protein